jgi:hypothetical protein
MNTLVLLTEWDQNSEKEKPVTALRIAQNATYLDVRNAALELMKDREFFLKISQSFYPILSATEASSPIEFSVNGQTFIYVSPKKENDNRCDPLPHTMPSTNVPMCLTSNNSLFNGASFGNSSVSNTGGNVYNPTFNPIIQITSPPLESSRFDTPASKKTTALTQKSLNSGAVNCSTTELPAKHIAKWASIFAKSNGTIYSAEKEGLDIVKDVLIAVAAGSPKKSKWTDVSPNHPENIWRGFNRLNARNSPQKIQKPFDTYECITLLAQHDPRKESESYFLEYCFKKAESGGRDAFDQAQNFFNNSRESMVLTMSEQKSKKYASILLDNDIFWKPVYGCSIEEFYEIFYESNKAIPVEELKELDDKEIEIIDDDDDHEKTSPQPQSSSFLSQPQQSIIEKGVVSVSKSTPSRVSSSCNDLLADEADADGPLYKKQKLACSQCTKTEVDLHECSKCKSNERICLVCIGPDELCAKCRASTVAVDEKPASLGAISVVGIVRSLCEEQQLLSKDAFVELTWIYYPFVVKHVVKASSESEKTLLSIVTENGDTVLEWDPLSMIVVKGFLRGEKPLIREKDYVISQYSPSPRSWTTALYLGIVRKVDKQKYEIAFHPEGFSEGHLSIDDDNPGDVSDDWERQVVPRERLTIFRAGGR